MTRILMIVLVSVVAFGGGFAGVYFNMPKESATPEESPESTSVESTPDTNDHEIPLPTAQDLAELPDSVELPTWITEIGSRAQLVSVMVDSLTAARSRLKLAEFRVSELETEVQRLKDAAVARQSVREAAAAMAMTLPKLEPKELTPILEGLEEAALLDLYEAASSRNRPAILAALKPERAAILVQSLMRGPTDATPTMAPSRGQ